MNAATAVVIVTFNAEKDLQECVDALGVSPAREIIVVDNCSSDRTRDIARGMERNGQIARLVESEENDGFARAVNRGIRAASADGIFLLNPDARIDGAGIDRMRDLSTADVSIGIIAPLVDSGPSVPTLPAGQQPRLWPLFTHFTGLARAFPRVAMLRGRHLYRSAHSYTQDVEWVSGCALYLTPSGRARVGELSERWFMYGEDIELAQRVRDAGLRVVMVADVVATHEIGGAVNLTESAVSTMWARNTFDYYRTQFHPGFVRRFLWRAIFSGGLGARAVLIQVRGLGQRGESAAQGTARARRFRRFAAAVWKRPVV